MNYYFVMDDKSNKAFNFDVEYGRVDFEIQKKLTRKNGLNL